MLIQEDSMRGSFPLPLGNFNAGESEYRQNIEKREAVRKLESEGIDLAETKFESFVERFPQRMEWLRINGDRFEWRYTTDPWKVFVAEVLLQRATGNDVSQFYNDFLKRYDTPYKVEKSSDEEVRRYLTGIGLQEKRVKTFNRAADQFVNRHGGIPKSINSLQEIKGVGPYISRATVLFSFGEPVALSDTNMVNFIENEFDHEVNSQTEGLPIMEAVTPQDAGIARALYFSIIDKGE